MKIPRPLFSMNATRPRYLVAGTVLMLASLPLHANAVLPGNTVVPDIFSDPGGSPPLLGDISGTFSFGSGPGLLTGTWEEVVLVDPLGATCTGCLDFALFLNEDSLLSSGIFNVGLARFFGYTTDVGYVDGTGITPVSVSRGQFGGMVNFNFTSASNVIGPGGGSAILVVATNAKTFDSLGILSINGGRDGSPANGQISGVFEPTFVEPTVPEPSTALLLGLGLTGLAAFRKRLSVEMRRSRK